MTSDPIGLAEGDGPIVSRPLALRVAQGVAALHADRVLAEVDKEERKYPTPENP